MRIQWLLNEFRGQENLPSEIVERDEASRENFLTFADDALRDAPASETGIFGRFVGTDTFTNSLGGLPSHFLSEEAAGRDVQEP
jgi:hypothetical protein